MKGKDTIKIKLDARSLRAMPRLIPQKIQEFCQRWGITNGVGVYDATTLSVNFSCLDDTGDPVENRRAIISLMAENGWETKE